MHSTRISQPQLMRFVQSVGNISLSSGFCFLKHRVCLSVSEQLFIPVLRSTCLYKLLVPGSDAIEAPGIVSWLAGLRLRDMRLLVTRFSRGRDQSEEADALLQAHGIAVLRTYLPSRAKHGWILRS